MEDGRCLPRPDRFRRKRIRGNYGHIVAVYRLGPTLSTPRRARASAIGARETGRRHHIRKMNSPATSPTSRTIVLVGLMGAGKTSVGRRLAHLLGLPFVDADKEIEKAAGCSIADIFATHGEAAFRDGERRVIARLLKDPPQVLAAGGGAFMDPKTRARIKARALSVWLRADIDLLLERVGRRRDRPLLNNGDRRATLEALVEERHPVYTEADIVIDCGRESAAATAERVCAAVRRYPSDPASDATATGTAAR